MARLTVLALGVVLLSSVVAGFYDGLQNSEVNRTVDISSTIEEIVIRLNVTNVGAEAASSYIVALPPQRRPHLAYIEATRGSGSKKTKLALKELARPDGAPETAYFELKWATPLQPNKWRRFQLVMGFTHVLSPLPAEIAQSQTQFMKYEGSAYFYSPYTTRKQSADFKTSSSKVESFSRNPKPVARRGAKITAGPYEDVAAYTSAEMGIHYQNPSPFLTVKNALREIEVSHWGRVSISEWYDVKNTGAKLTGPYSMLEQQQKRNIQKAAFRNFDAKLPKSADNVFFVDRIGNISSSNVYKARDHVKVELKPRYTLYGGWEADFNFGYQVPSDEFVGVSTADSTMHQLKVPVSIPFDDCVVDNLTVKVILPEGAANIEPILPFSVDYLGEEIRKSYLDTSGRPVVVFNKKNVVDFHKADLAVNYSFSKLAILREPMFLFLGFFAGLMIFLGFSHMSVSLSVKGDNAADIVVSKPAELEGLFGEGSEKGRHGSSVSRKFSKATLHLCKAIIRNADRFTKSCDDALRKGSFSKSAEKTFTKLCEELDDLANTEPSLESYCTRLQGMASDMHAAVTKKDRSKLQAVSERLSTQLEKIRAL